MADFVKFSKLIHARYNELAKHELFVAGDGYATADHYLASFPEGSNPIYKTHTEHDCSCCKQFIRNLGNVVAVIDGKIETIWSIKGAEYPYNKVAADMDAYVQNQAITGVFRTSERSYGAEESKQLLEGGSVKRWNHFHGKVADRHFSKQPDKDRGDYSTTAAVFKRGLEELSFDSLQMVVDLIAEKALYRGEEHLPAIKAFEKLQKAYAKVPTGHLRGVFIWANAGAPGARFRNTVIGTLIQDLSEGKDMEKAVKSFEDKVAPANYKRPTALVTPGMVKQAMKTIEALGYEPSLERRMARISDVSVNNVLWVDNTVKSQMKGGLGDLLMASITAKPVKDLKAEEISIDEFMSKVMPSATAIEMLVQNRHAGNFMTLTAPVNEQAAGIFKWGNNFAWSYAGNITDSVKELVAARGGRVDGVLRFSHSWNYGARNASLMDLHVFLPGSNGKSSPHADGCSDGYPSTPRVGWNRRNDAKTQGCQDVDYTDAAPEGYVPVENITFPTLKLLPEGEYTFKIHNWALRQPTQGGFRAEIAIGGDVYEYEYISPLRNKEWVTVAKATLKNGQFTIDHKLTPGHASRDQWGIKTEQFVKVITIMNSPNHWDGESTGNKHVFFILDGCKTTDAVRGIYNEFLKSSLDAHRKVFELVGDKTKCPPADDQLSGLGFSTTQSNSVTVKVFRGGMRQVFNIKF